jgi:hypothetical protein
VLVVAVGQLRDMIDSRTSNSFVGRGLPLGQATALALGQQLRALARNRLRLQLLTPNMEHDRLLVSVAGLSLCACRERGDWSVL